MPIDSFTGQYAYLSNFYPSTITYEGIIYPTVEHAFQAAKTLDRLERFHISQLKSPAEAKRAGRQVALRGDWEQVKYRIMWECLVIKFGTHEDLGALLYSTRPETLIEGNTWGDTVWGQVNGVGQNALGVLLMAVRDLTLEGYWPDLRKA